jgi:hypothetical protein
MSAQGEDLLEARQFVLDDVVYLLDAPLRLRVDLVRLVVAGIFRIVGWGQLSEFFLAADQV